MLGISEFVFLMTVVICLVWFIDDRFISGKELPPGPARVPFLGTIALLQAGAKKESPYVTFQSWRKKYGPIMTSKFGFLQQVIVDDPTIIREILTSDDWIDRPFNSFIQERSYGKSLGVLWGIGEPWKELRRFSIRTLRDFGFGKQMSQERMVEEELEEVVKALNEKLEAGGNVVKMEQFFSVSVLNIIWSMIAGIRFSHKDERIQELLRNVSETLRQVSAGGNVLMAFPFLRHILKHFPGKVRNRNHTLAKLQNYFQDILIERRKEGTYKDDQRDFIDVFLTEIDKHKQGNSNASEVFTDQQFITTLIDLFVAGSETTANTSEKKVQEEIDHVIGRDRFPTQADRLNLPYTEATIHEIQRIANIVPLNSRVPTKDVLLGGYHIKKGTFAVLNMFSYHHNPQVWQSPNDFRPERFLDSQQKIINTDNLLVFGGGKRVCMGEILARATLFNYFSTFMQNYTFEASPSHPKPSAENPRFGLTMTPQPFFALVTPRPV